MLSDVPAKRWSRTRSHCRNAPYGAHLGGLLENVACNSASIPSRLESASLRCRGFLRSLKFELRELHAKFSGARCFLICFHRGRRVRWVRSLNAPFGARCFLTAPDPDDIRDIMRRLNAPFGARCFLTGNRRPVCAHGCEGS